MGKSIRVLFLTFLLTIMCAAVALAYNPGQRTIKLLGQTLNSDKHAVHLVFIPAALRRELGQTFHVTMGQDHCLSVYSDESWAAFMDKLKALSYNEVKKLRALFAYAADCEPDAQGRILLPAKLREYAGLTRDVVVIGSFDRAEIWDAGRWAALESEAFDSGELESAMAEMGL